MLVNTPLQNVCQLSSANLLLFLPVRPSLGKLFVFPMLFRFIQYAIRCVYTGAGTLLPTVCRLSSANMSVPIFLQFPPLCHLYEQLNLFFCALYDFMLSNIQLGRFVTSLQTQHWQVCNNSVVGEWCQPFVCDLSVD